MGGERSARADGAKGGGGAAGVSGNMKDDGGVEQSETQKPPAAMFCEISSLAPTPFFLPAKFWRELLLFYFFCPLPPRVLLNLTQHHFQSVFDGSASVADSHAKPPEAVATPNTLSVLFIYLKIEGLKPEL